MTATTRMANPTIAPSTPPIVSDVIPILPCSLPRTRRFPPNRPCILLLVSSLQALQPSIDLPDGSLLIMQLSDRLNNIGHVALGALPANRPVATARQGSRGAEFRILDPNTPAPRQGQAGSVIVTQPWPSRAVG